MLCRSRWRGNRYVAVVGRAFLVEYLYGSKHSPHLGVYPMPYVYVKAVLLCAASQSFGQVERRQLHSMIEALTPVHSSQDHLAQEELLSFVDAAMPHDEATRREDGGESVANKDSNDYIDNAEKSDANAAHYVDDDEDIAEDGGTGNRGGGDRYESLTSSLSSSSSSSSSWCALEACDPIASMLSPATFPSRVARVLIYDAVSTCAARGSYDARDRERVALVSARIGLSSAVREQIEVLVMRERALARRRCAQLHLQPCFASHAATTCTSSHSRTSAETRNDGDLKTSREGVADEAGRANADMNMPVTSCHPQCTDDATQSSTLTPQHATAGDMSDSKQATSGNDEQSYTLSFADMKRILRRARSQRPSDEW